MSRIRLHRAVVVACTVTGLAAPAAVQAKPVDTPRVPVAARVSSDAPIVSGDDAVAPINAGGVDDGLVVLVASGAAIAAAAGGFGFGRRTSRSAPRVGAAQTPTAR